MFNYRRERGKVGKNGRYCACSAEIFLLRAHGKTFISLSPSWCNSEEGYRLWRHLHRPNLTFVCSAHLILSLHLSPLLGDQSDSMGTLEY